MFDTVVGEAVSAPFFFIILVETFGIGVVPGQPFMRTDPEHAVLYFRDGGHVAAGKWVLRAVGTVDFKFGSVETVQAVTGTEPNVAFAVFQRPDDRVLR